MPKIIPAIGTKIGVDSAEATAPDGEAQNASTARFEILSPHSR